MYYLFATSRSSFVNSKRIRTSSYIWLFIILITSKLWWTRYYAIFKSFFLFLYRWQQRHFLKRWICIGIALMYLNDTILRTASLIVNGTKPVKIKLSAGNSKNNLLINLFRLLALLKAPVTCIARIYRIPKRPPTSPRNSRRSYTYLELFDCSELTPKRIPCIVFGNKLLKSI